MKYLYFFSIIFFISCSKQPKSEEKPINNLIYSKAKAFRDNGDTDSAYLYFSKAKDVFLADKDSVGVGASLLNMAIISTDNGDLLGGQELSLSASAFFDSTDSSQHIYIKSNLNNLGISNYHLKYYTKALAFYYQSSKYTADSIGTLTLQNNIANAYRRLNNFEKALDIYENILKQRISQAVFARTLSDFAYTKWLQNKSYNAAPALQKGLFIRQKTNDYQGQISSLAYLIDIYEKNRPALALNFAERMYQTANKINNPNDRLVALQKLIKLSPVEKTKGYFNVFYSLSDSIQTARNTAKNQFALIRYESEKSKADNLILQKDNQAKKYQLVIIISISLLFLFFGLFWYRKRKQKMALEAQNAIRQSQLKTSIKVHDVVSNGLYRVMKDMESQKVDKDLIDRVEDLYEESRDISYEDPINNKQPLDTKVADLLKSFATENVHIAIAGNSAKLWESVSPTVFYEVEHVVQELMVNMKKHSKADKVGLRFERIENEIHIYYLDNGVGMPSDIKFTNGLRNTGNRISSIGGVINFDRKREKGLRVQISFPVT